MDIYGNSKVLSLLADHMISFLHSVNVDFCYFYCIAFCVSVRYFIVCAIIVS